MPPDFPTSDPNIVTDRQIQKGLIGKSFYVDTVVRNLLRDFYSQTDRQGYPGLRGILWKEDNRSSGGVNDPDSVRIDLADTWNPSRAGSAPAILVRGNDIASIRLGIGDKNMSPRTNSFSGGQIYTRAFASSITLFCLARLPRQARLFALQSAEYLQHFHADISQCLDLTTLQVGQITMTKPLRELPSILASTVVLEYSFFNTWDVLPAAPKIKRFQSTVGVHS